MNPLKLPASIFVGTISWFGALAFGQAATVSYGPSSVPTEPTNWSESISIQQFDPSLGNLTGVSFQLDGHVLGDASVESTDSLPSAVTLDVSAQIKLTAPGGSTITAIPIASASANLDEADGIPDFGGPSGTAVTGLSNSQTVTGSVPTIDFGLYTGLSTINLALDAEGHSKASGSGNLITFFSTNAGADVTVTYTYDDPIGTGPAPVPEPGAALPLLALAGLMARRRTRRS